MLHMMSIVPHADVTTLLGNDVVIGSEFKPSIDEARLDAEAVIFDDILLNDICMVVELSSEGDVD